MKKNYITTFTLAKRHLPHWQLPNSVYFITTRCLKGTDLTPEYRDVVMDSIRYLDCIGFILFMRVSWQRKSPLKKEGQRGL